MSETTTQNNWPELYQEALLESDPMKVPARIEEAHQAIHRRALELWYSGEPNTEEQRELNTALHFLDLLRMVGRFEAGTSQVSNIAKQTHEDSSPHGSNPLSITAS